MRNVLANALIAVFGRAYLRGPNRELWLVLNLMRLLVCFLVSHVVVLVISGSWIWSLIQGILWHLVPHTRIALVASDGSLWSCLLVGYAILYLVYVILLKLRVRLISISKTWRRNYRRWIINLGVVRRAHIWLTCNYFTVLFVYGGRGVRWR